MNITVIGTGFVGVVSAAVYASFGNKVIGLDIDQKKIDSLQKSIVPFFEPGLSKLLTQQQKNSNLSFTTEYQSAISNADIVVIAVNTPSKASGEADLTYVFSACESLARYLKPDTVVVVKSTVPPGTLTKVTERIQAITNVPFMTASVPEFLKEGSAVTDTLHPDRVVIGATDERAIALLKELHQPLTAPVVIVSPESAQMAKYAANAYLATRITFINQIAELCETASADVQDVIAAIGLDKRIGNHYWYPGLGYGGSCFPKDVKELAAYSRKVGLDTNLFNKLDELNTQRPVRVLENFSEKIGGWGGKTVAVLGLSFKPNTNDMREAPSLAVIPHLLKHGARVSAYDPEALDTAQLILGTPDGLTYARTIVAACESADVIMVLIEWSEFLVFDFSAVRTTKQQWFIDARNQFDPTDIRKLGYLYLGIGRV